MRTVACGKAHTVVSVEVRDDKDGGSHYELYAFGSNGDGQLGVGKGTKFSEKPVRLEAARALLRGEVGGGGDPGPPPRLAAGSAHTLALLPAAGGRVLVWGDNTEGQLGLGPDAEETVCVPTALDLRLGPDEEAKQVRDLIQMFYKSVAY